MKRTKAARKTFQADLGRRPVQAGELSPGDARISFIASPAEQAILKHGLRKYGLRNKSEIIRMALTRFAESEGIDPAGLEKVS